MIGNEWCNTNELTSQYNTSLNVLPGKSYDINLSEDNMFVYYFIVGF